MISGEGPEGDGFATSGDRAMPRTAVAGGDLLLRRSLRTDLALLHEGRTVPDYLSEICDRMDQIEPRVRAFVPERARRGRMLAAGRTARGSWQGIAVGVKDIIHVDGLPTLAGSTVPPEELAGPQASAVTRLLAAGAVVAGKTVTAEFAVTAPGPTTNPHHVGHTPGGSSSGSAAAVAAGLVPLALGTQTIASTIRPAAYCGVVGFKPTYGRVPLDGVIANAPSLDTLGWFTADISDAIAAASIICADWQPAPTPGRLPVLGVPAAQFLGKASEAGQCAFERNVDVLRAAGFQVRHFPLLQEFDVIRDRLFVINRWELARTHAVWFSRHVERYRPQTAAAIAQGQQIAYTDYAAALRWKRDFADAYARATASAAVDVWIAPAATGTAPAGLDSTGDSVMGVPTSLVGAPVVSIPAGNDRSGLPYGLQCAGTANDDEQLLAFSTAIESALAPPDVR